METKLKNYLKESLKKKDEYFLDGFSNGCVLGSLITLFIAIILGFLFKGDDLFNALGALILFFNFFIFIFIFNKKKEIKIEEEIINLELEKIKSFLKEKNK